MTSPITSLSLLVITFDIILYSHSTTLMVLNSSILVGLWILGIKLTQVILIDGGDSPDKKKVWTKCIISTPILSQMNLINLKLNPSGLGPYLGHNSIQPFSPHPHWVLVKFSRDRGAKLLKQIGS